MADEQNSSQVEIEADPDTRTVVVTGISTGIGYGVAQVLIRAGYQVIGTVRKAEDAERVRGELGVRLLPVLMDVADDDDVQRAAAEIRTLVGERGLAGLVNNAGMAVAGPLMHIDLEELRYQFDVNVVGVVAMTQAMLPLLQRTGDNSSPPGRIINISSVSGYITYPFLAPYAASKHALEAISDGMRCELALYGIPVSVMVLGAVATPIWGKTKENDLARYTQTDFAEGVKQLMTTAGELSSEGMPVARVAAAVRQALETPKPKARYVLVNDYWRGWLLPQWLPTRFLDYAMTRQFGLTRKV
jgi:NAD(P)-dependent dehydrogenase (short-subunit alcohol dehydrogenase family)